MRVLAIDSPPSLDLAKAIDSFEQQFSYPLGTKTRFRISHGDNYCRFYQSMGECLSLIAEEDGIIHGAIASALRSIRSPEGERISAAYVGDFKVSEQARGTRTAYRLLKEMQQWILSRTNYAFSIVMNGTPNSPLDYTGRLDIAKFEFLGEVSILRVAIKDLLPAIDKSLLVAQESGASLHESLVKGRWSMPTGTPTLRSTMEAQWLIGNNRSACGLIEDTRKAKRLFTLDNEEILTAHLSNFAYSTPASGAEVIRMSLEYIAKYGYTSVFVATDPEDVSVFQELLAPYETSEARASIFGNIPPSTIKKSRWSVNTSEI